jgi:hypothetical protein
MIFVIYLKTICKGNYIKNWIELNYNNTKGFLYIKISKEMSTPQKIIGDFLKNLVKIKRYNMF